MPQKSVARKVPFLIGRYRCEEYLGGGMADVYRARDTELPRDVALKILSPESLHDVDIRSAFSHEAQLASQCSHDNIVSIYDKGEYKGCPYIVMEFLRGENLGTVIQRHALGDLKNILRIAIQAARALECVHAQNIVHRDLKPQNLHLDRSGRVKLVDFGIAKSLEWSRTQAGVIKGTVYYMAPEQVLGEPVSFRTDVWSFGVVLFEMLTDGCRPFEGTTIHDLWAAIVKANPEFELLTRHGAPEPLKRLVQRCLEKQPERRYSGFRQIKEELKAILQTISDAPSAPPQPVSPRPPKSRVKEAWQHLALWPKLGIASAGTALLATVVVLLIAGPFRSPPTRLKLDSGDMVLVPGGPALVGPDNQKADIPAVYVDVTEVSNGAYAAFLRETSHPKPKDFREDKPDYPVINVTYYDAIAFAKWAGKRLLSDAEWEKAARGANGRLFPWGNSADPTLANVANNPKIPEHTLMPVRSFQAGASPFGVLNMCGNVWEWVSTSHQPKADYLKAMQENHLPVRAEDVFYSIRGGYYENDLSPDLIRDFSSFPAKLGASNIGFRCGKSVK